MSIEAAQRVLKIEEEGLAAVRANIGEEFVAAIDAVLGCRGRVIITGIGKSGLVGQKICATLNSTGTSSLFLHPVEAMHGDLGIVGRDDIVLAISYSGETAELNALLIAIRERGNTIIAMTGGRQSTLAEAADIVLDIHVPKEACPLGLAPTASTTATLAMGDALSVVLINRRRFQAEDFRFNHPGGSLGQRLKVQVTEVMSKGIDIPVVEEDARAEEAMSALHKKNKGAVLVVAAGGSVVGIVTDGDIRRAFMEGIGVQKMQQLFAKDLMTEKPICIKESHLAADALSIMQKYEITALPVIDDTEQLVGLIHLHDLLGKGEFRFLV